MLCPKISTSWGKLAPTGRHGRHVFATLVTRGVDTNVIGTALSIHPAVDSTTNDDGDKYETKFAEQIQ